VPQRGRGTWPWRGRARVSPSPPRDQGPRSAAAPTLLLLPRLCDLSSRYTSFPPALHSPRSSSADPPRPSSNHPSRPPRPPSARLQNFLAASLLASASPRLHLCTPGTSVFVPTTTCTRARPTRTDAQDLQARQGRSGPLWPLRRPQGRRHPPVGRGHQGASWIRFRAVS